LHFDLQFNSDLSVLLKMGAGEYWMA